GQVVQVRLVVEGDRRIPEAAVLEVRPGVRAGQIDDLTVGGSEIPGVDPADLERSGRRPGGPDRTYRDRGAVGQPSIADDHLRRSLAQSRDAVPFQCYDCRIGSGPFRLFQEGRVDVPPAYRRGGEIELLPDADLDLLRQDYDAMSVVTTSGQ